MICGVCFEYVDDGDQHKICSTIKSLKEKIESEKKSRELFEAGIIECMKDMGERIEKLIDNDSLKKFINQEQEKFSLLEKEYKKIVSENMSLKKRISHLNDTITLLSEGESWVKTPECCL